MKAYAEMWLPPLLLVSSQVCFFLLAAHHEPAGVMHLLVLGQHSWLAMQPLVELNIHIIKAGNQIVQGAVACVERRH